jgi:lipoprotein-anchoring transpeptidase ErfK/SrfK
LVSAFILHYYNAIILQKNFEKVLMMRAMLMKTHKIGYSALLFGISITLMNPQYALGSELKTPSPRNNTTDISNSLPTRLQVDLNRRRVFVYRGKTRIKSYPIAVGRANWKTPTGNFQVLQVLENPIWINPFTGKAIPAGHPNNPLGDYWIGFWTNGRNWIGFHGTPNPESVGKAVSHGCLRMHNQDIKELFHLVSLGTPLTVTE